MIQRLKKRPSTNLSHVVLSFSSLPLLPLSLFHFYGVQTPWPPSHLFYFLFLSHFRLFLVFPSHSLLDFFSRFQPCLPFFWSIYFKTQTHFLIFTMIFYLLSLMASEVSLGWCGFRIHGGGRWFGDDSCVGCGWCCGVNVCGFDCVCVSVVLN